MNQSLIKLNKQFLRSFMSLDITVNYTSKISIGRSGEASKIVAFTLMQKCLLNIIPLTYVQHSYRLFAKIIIIIRE